MNDLTVSLEGIDHQLLLDEWRWLVPQRMTILSVTVLGDIFLPEVNFPKLQIPNPPFRTPSETRRYETTGFFPRLTKF
jgi:hypothetical protein